MKDVRRCQCGKIIQSIANKSGLCRRCYIKKKDKEWVERRKNAKV